VNLLQSRFEIYKLIEDFFINYMYVEGLLRVLFVRRMVEREKGEKENIIFPTTLLERISYRRLFYKNLL
jgi:type 1 glutamine amidotransferase